ncbi:Uncharacterised protein [Vibrio cholerae]|nr:Uncharacterised protein [Vibrio cholerae]CSI72134.1 Uncharacterised protein [Vibrio cholerae]
MSLTIGSDNPRAVDGKHHRQVHDRHIVDQLIVTTL